MTAHIWLATLLALAPLPAPAQASAQAPSGPLLPKPISSMPTPSTPTSSMPTREATGAIPAAAPVATDTDAPAEELAALFDRTDRFTIPIRIGDSGPYRFLVDTGSQTTIISHQLARQLALEPNKAVTINSLTGLTDVRTVAIPRLSYGSRDVHDLRVPVLPAENIGAIGLLGLDSLQDSRLVIDNRAGTMQLIESRAPAVDDAIVVQARSRFGQLILVDSMVEGQKVSVVLDTGAEHSVGNAALYAALTRKKRVPETFPVTLTSVTGAAIVGHLAVMHAIRIGGINMRDVPVVFMEASPFAQMGLKNKPALLLGMDVLGTFARVDVDFQRRRVSFLMSDQALAPTARMARSD